MAKHLKIDAADNWQASAMVVNGLGQLGILDRVSCDGSWWIHHARTEQFAVVQDGLLKSLRLTHTSASSFFTLSELMAANLRIFYQRTRGIMGISRPSRCAYRLARSGGPSRAAAPARG